MAKKIHIRTYLGALFLFWGSWLSAQYPPDVVPYEVSIYGEPASGCMFLSPFSSSLVGAHPPNLMVLDSAGELIWYAPLGPDTEIPYSNPKVTDFKPLPDGRYAYWIANSPETWYLLDADFQLQDSIRCQGFSTTDDHDLLMDADGRFHLLCDSIENRDLSHLYNRDSIQGHPNGLVLYQIVQTQDAEGRVLKNWAGIDHLPFDEMNMEHWDNGYFMDYMHTNSLSLDPNGKMVLSNRNLCEITAYDTVSGAVQWRMGGEGNEFTLEGDTVFFDAQHDANFTPEGNLYLFDNGTLGAKEIGRYVEYEMDWDRKHARLVREILHPASQRSWFMGNAIHLPNDHVIISWGGLDSVDAYPQITEYDARGDAVMDLDLKNPFLSYRVYKDPRPWTLARPAVECDPIGQTLTAPAGYAQYTWNTGETTQSIRVEAPGTYQVWVNQGIGKMSSEKISIADPADLCAAFQDSPTEFQVYPQPSDASVTLAWPAATEAEEWRISVFDAQGSKLLERSGINSTSIELEVREWTSGVYWVRVEGNALKYTGKIIRK